MDEVNEKTPGLSANAETAVWFKAAHVSSFPENGGSCVKYGSTQIAVFYFKRRDQWYACQNMCPHKMQMILSRGIIGSQDDEPKVSCPFHKKTFSLNSGDCLNADEQRIRVYPVRVENDYVYIDISS